MGQSGLIEYATKAMETARVAKRAGALPQAFPFLVIIYSLNLLSFSLDNLKALQYDLFTFLPVCALDSGQFAVLKFIFRTATWPDSSVGRARD